MFLTRRGSIYYLGFNGSDGKRAKVSTGCKNKSDALKSLQCDQLNLFGL